MELNRHSEAANIKLHNFHHSSASQSSSLSTPAAVSVLPPCVSVSFSRQSCTIHFLRNDTRLSSTHRKEPSSLSAVFAELHVSSFFLAIPRPPLPPCRTSPSSVHVTWWCYLPARRPSFFLNLHLHQQVALTKRRERARRVWDWVLLLVGWDMAWRWRGWDETCGQDKTMWSKAKEEEEGRVACSPRFTTTSRLKKRIESGSDPEYWCFVSFCTGPGHSCPSSIMDAAKPSQESRTKKRRPRNEKPFDNALLFLSRFVSPFCVF